MIISLRSGQGQGQGALVMLASPSSRKMVMGKDAMTRGAMLRRAVKYGYLTSN